MLHEYGYVCVCVYVLNECVHVCVWACICGVDAYGGQSLMLVSFSITLHPSFEIGHLAGP